MKRFVPRIPAIVVVVFALCSLGSKSSSGCNPFGSESNQSTQSNQDPSKPWCYMDPPVNCIAFCIGVNEIAFPNCDDPASGPWAALFKEQVLNAAAEQLVLGVQVCPAANSKKWVTPCQVGITPVEHPNQDHEVCQTVPPGCPTL
jgi:hypothetical protein